MAYRHGAPVGEHSVAFAFASVDVGSGTNYAGGYYDHGAAADDFNPGITHGTADNAYGAHVYIVQAVGAGGGDTTVRITGTSWAPSTGTRTGGDTEDIVVSDSGAAGDYYQSTKHWIGQVAIAKNAGPDLLCNYGFVTTWEHNEEDWVLCSFKVIWQGDGNDAGTDIILYHHNTTGWTYNVGAEADPPILYDMQTDYNTEFESNNNAQGCYERYDLSDTIAASSGEGVIVAGVQTGQAPFGVGTALLCVRHP